MRKSSRNELQMVQKDMKKRSQTSLIIKEIQTKTTPKVWEFSSMVDHLLSKCLAIAMTIDLFYCYDKAQGLSLEAYNFRGRIHDCHYRERDSRQEVMVLEL